MNLLRRMFLAKSAAMAFNQGGFNPFGSWEEFSSIVNRAGYAWQNLIGQGRDFGVWTPTLTIDSSSTGITYAYREGFYTKVGRGVVVYCDIGLSSKGTTVGGVRIEGLPFGTPGADFAGGTGAVAWSGLATAFVNILAVVNSTGVSYIDLRGITAANANFVTQLTDANLNNTSTLQFSLAYYTTS